MTFQEKLKKYTDSKIIPEKYSKLLQGFYDEYCNTLSRKGDSIDNHREIFEILVELVRDQCQNPFHFDHFHKSIRAPFDYYIFGIEFLRPLINYEENKTYGLEIFDQIEQQLEKGHNAIFLANHQIEADPQAMSLLLERTHPKIAEEKIFIAGERVITDPLAVPFSLGCNLLCIYSKRYIDHPPELQEQKQLHNKKTMQIMSELLAEGGKAIYVAPSGGRDRQNAKGVVELAPFDGKSIEMMCLMAKKSKHPTHFYPLALKTYSLLPPPSTIQTEIGERRIIEGSGIKMAVVPEVDMNVFPGSDIKDKHERREKRALYIHNLVVEAYDTL